MIKVYFADISNLPDPIENPEILKGLTEDRKEKAMRYKQLKDRKQCVGAGLLLKQCLLDQNIYNTSIHIGDNGKPEIEGICFNLSHSHDMIACVIANRSVGCDIEKIGKPRDKIADHFFTEREISYLSQFEGEKKTEQFYRLWTMKESYMKMTGEGMRLALDRFEVLIDDEIAIIRDGQKVSCHVKEYEIPEYKFTVCSEEDEFADKVEWVKLILN